MVNIVTRFAPSPTGFLHIGSARTALFNWLFARHHQGKFLLRIEDTDLERSTAAAVTAILDGLKWLGLDWDEPEVYQSQRFERHREVAHQLVASGKAYYCYCSPEELEQMRAAAMAQGLPPRYDGTWRDRDPATAPAGVKPVVRLKAPQTGSTVIEDGVQGRVEIDNRQLDDMVLLRSDGTPTYMLSVVVDDYDMKITHIIRGDDHLNNAFRQYHLYQACGWTPPAFNHIPLIHGNDGAKLSKRHGALGVEAYRDMGYLPEAINNYLLRLGWGHGDDEIISQQQAIEWFDLAGVGRSAARFDFDKLGYLNGYYLRQLEPAVILKHLQPFIAAELAARQIATVADHRWRWLEAGMPELQQRARTLVELAQHSLFYLLPLPLTMDEAAQKLLQTADVQLIQTQVRHQLEQLEEWNETNIEQALRQVADTAAVKLVKIAQPLRAYLTGSTTSPSIFNIMAIMGKDETLRRLPQA